MSVRLAAFRPTHRLDVAGRRVSAILSEEQDALAVLQDRANEIMLKPASAAGDTKKFADSIIQKFEWVKTEFLAVKDILQQCKASGGDCSHATIFYKHMEEAHLAYYHLKLIHQRGLSVSSESFKTFFDQYVVMVKALNACSSIASRW